MKLNPHLNFGGQCQEAFEFYERCLGGKIVTMLTYCDSPMAEEAPPEFRGKIMHATLKVGDDTLYGADVGPDRYQQPKSFHLTLGTHDPAEAERIFLELSQNGRELSQNGAVQMPLQKTFWAVLFGVVTDRFGISWEINCEQAQ